MTKRDSDSAGEELSRIFTTIASGHEAVRNDRPKRREGNSHGKKEAEPKKR